VSSESLGIGEEADFKRRRGAPVLVRIQSVGAYGVDDVPGLAGGQGKGLKKDGPVLLTIRFLGLY